MNVIARRLEVALHAHSLEIASAHKKRCQLVSSAPTFNCFFLLAVCRMYVDILFIAYCGALFSLPLIVYKLTLPDSNGREKRTKDWHYAIKRILCWRKLTQFMNRRVELPPNRPHTPTDQWEEDALVFHALDTHNSSLYIRFAVGKLPENGRSFAEITLQLRLSDGRMFVLPQDVLLCSLRKQEWRTKILTITRQLDGNFRLIFNGFLRQVVSTSSADEEEKIEHVAFSLIFARASERLIYPKFFDRGSFGDAVCRAPWRDGNWTEKLGDQIGENHFGLLHGTIKSLGFKVEEVLRMGAYQIRRFGTADRYECSRSVAMLTLGEDGTLSYVEHRRTAHSPSTQVRHGAVLHPDGKTTPVKGCDLPLPDQHGHVSSMTVHISTAQRQLKSFVAVNNATELQYSYTHSDGAYSVSTKLGETTTTGGPAISSIIFFRKTANKPTEVEIPPLICTTSDEPTNTDLILSLTTPQARNLSLTGGKGQSLAILTELQTEGGYKVPPGFVITTRAMEDHLETDNLTFRQAMVRLKRSTTTEAIKVSCKTLQNYIMTTPFHQNLEKDLNDFLGRLKPTVVDPSYAVRSSGVSEDSEVTSSAGQNETYLGCRTPGDILTAVRKCWASLYAFRSVEYRRNRGLDIETSMAVVVQEMTDSRIAGVLFTCDLDGNPGNIRITSSYGLGESVVSGEEGGDVVYVRRTWDDQISIQTEEAHAKQSKIVLSPDGVRKVCLSDAHSKGMSITSAESLILARVATFLESKYGRHLDIEWAFEGDSVVLHQARPVTYLENWGDWELEHEFDAAIICDRDVFTTANVKEVLPGAVTPLTNSTILQSVDQSAGVCTTADWRRQHTSTRRQYIVSVGYHIFMSFHKILLKMPADTLDLTTRSIDISVCGHAVTTPEMLRRAIAMHGRTTRLTRLRSIWDMVRCCWRSGRLVEEAIQLADERFPPNVTGLMELTHAIDRRLAMFERVMDTHSLSSRACSFYQMIAMSMLTNEDSDGKNPDALTPAKFAQIALLFSNGSGVISADIPADLEDIAKEIRASPLRDTFNSRDPKSKECADCLEEISEAWTKYQKFLKKHGHRSFREFELMEVSWGDNTSVLMKMLQTLARLNLATQKAPEMSVDEVVEKLQSKVNPRFLRFLIGKCRAGIVNRERSKSELVRQVNILRGAFALLGERLHQIQIIPSADLVYFLTYDEINWLIKNEDPTLIAKAMRRKRLYQTWNTFKFPEMSTGIPQPIQAKTFCGDDAQKELKGTPVCGGFVKARCCCIDDLANIDELQQGDVLITHGTDVGWTPYFPMLSGVVTELGGLISHGAVVAREYGLPCLVGVDGALENFKTGDHVVLDASGGSIYRVTPDDDQK